VAVARSASCFPFGPDDLLDLLLFATQ